MSTLVLNRMSGTTTNSAYKQTFSVPVGRHVVRAWVKTTSVVVGTGQGAAISLDAGTATGTFTDSTRLTGTNGFTLVEAVANVTVAGTINVYMVLGYSGTATGTAIFSNIYVVPSVTGTSITPNTITTTNLLATAIDAMTITGATFRTASTNPKVAFDSTGFYVTDVSANKLIQVTAAGGLSILQGSTTPQKVSWSNAGSSFADIFASYSGGVGSIFIESQAQAIGDTSHTIIQAADNVPAVASQIDLSWSNAGGGVARVLVPPANKLLMNSSKNSDFVQAWQTSPQKIARIAWTADAGWSTYANNYYWKDQLGYVHIIGEIQNTSGSTKAAGASIFTLPAGYRPDYRFYFAGGANDGNIKLIQVLTTGVVQVGDNGPGVITSPTAGSHVNIGHIIFHTTDAVT